MGNQIEYTMTMLSSLSDADKVKVLTRLGMVNEHGSLTAKYASSLEDLKTQDSDEQVREFFRELNIVDFTNYPEDVPRWRVTLDDSTIIEVGWWNSNSTDLGSEFFSVEMRLGDILYDKDGETLEEAFLQIHDEILSKHTKLKQEFNVMDRRLKAFERVLNNNKSLSYEDYNYDSPDDEIPF